jgi:hypothetical protein
VTFPLSAIDEQRLTWQPGDVEVTDEGDGEAASDEGE